MTFDGEEISSRPPQAIVALGISHAPEGRHVFPRMTVRENLEMGAYLRRDKDVESDLEPGLSSSSRASRSASARRRARCPAASSRCWRSAAR